MLLFPAAEWKQKGKTEVSNNSFKKVWYERLLLGSFSNFWTGPVSFCAHWEKAVECIFCPQMDCILYFHIFFIYHWFFSFMIISTSQKHDVLFVKFAHWKHLIILHINLCIYAQHRSSRPSQIPSYHYKNPQWTSMGIKVSPKTGCRKKSTKYHQRTLISEQHCSSLRTRMWSGRSLLQATCWLFPSKSTLIFLIVKDYLILGGRNSKLSSI